MRRISVIIPCYNVAQYIDRCLSSVVAQTIGVENLEIIIIDDASVDDTWAHLQIWEQQYSDNMILIRQEVNRRQGAARNLGLQYASADWIAFVDADDWLEPDYFEQLYFSTTKYNCDVVACGYIRDGSETFSFFNKYERGDKKDQYIVPDDEATRNDLIANLPVGGEPWGKIIRKSLLVDFQILFPEDLTYEDIYWHSLLHIYTTGLYIVGKNLYHYFVNPHSTILTRNDSFHIDWITVWLMKWREYDRRGLLQKYREGLELDCLHDATGILKVILVRYDEPSFSLFQLEREMLKEWVPDYKKYEYAIKEAGIGKVLIEMLYAPVNRTDFHKMAKKIREYWDYEAFVKQ